VLSVAVTPEGSVLLPGIGLTRVLGLSLDATERQIRQLVLRYYRNVEVNVALGQIRSFKVFVVGNVPSPGVRTASAATRVSEVIPGVAEGPHRRNVLLRRANGDTLTVDLVRFVQTGDLSANPTLREGDALIVPTADKIVQVYGRVYFPGVYEYRAGESLTQLLSIANGAGDFPSNAADTIRVTRFVGADQRRLHLFTRAQAMGAEGQRFVLEPFDAVYVSVVQNYKQQITATVNGQVVRPGVYPIRPDTTTIRELVAMAGGLLPDASLVEASLRRAPRGTVGQAARELERIPVELLSGDERRLLQTRNQGDASFVVIDFQQLFTEGKEAFDQKVERDDILNVPARRTGISIVGAVGTPGIVQYVPGRGVDYYVEQAGGYSRKADRRNQAVLKARLGTRTDPRDVRSLDPGDQIVVPFREPRRYLQTIQGTVTTVTGLLLSVYAVKQLFNF